MPGRWRYERDWFDVNRGGDEKVTAAAETLIARRRRLVRLVAEGSLQPACVTRAQPTSENLECRDEENRCGSGTRTYSGSTHVRLTPIVGLDRRAVKRRSCLLSLRELTWDEVDVEGGFIRLFPTRADSSSKRAPSAIRSRPYPSRFHRCLGAIVPTVFPNSGHRSSAGRAHLRKKKRQVLLVSLISNTMSAITTIAASSVHTKPAALIPIIM